MKTPEILLFAAALIALTACDRGYEAQRLAEERAALEREKAELAADKSAAERAALDEERARLAEERAALGEDSAKLSARAAAEREARLAAERRAEDEATARKDAEENARKAAQAAVTQARAEQSVEFFYEALDPFGDWINVERYGYCWRPNEVRNPRWRPYTDGGWVYTDYGWTWRANEPFGWATYHYGRWTRLPRLGWVWVPGTEWGPAWVSWRRSDDYIGWAPLPPDAWSSSGFTAAVDSYFDIGPGLYNFVAVADLGESTYVGRVVEPERNVTIVNQTTNVTNVTYKTVQNNVTIVNNGPDIMVINKRSRVPVQQLATERVASEVAAAAPAKIEGKTLRIVAPNFKHSAPTAKPKRVKEEVKGVREERGWEEAKDDAPKIREQAAKRARQAEEEQKADGASEDSARRRVRVAEPASPEGAARRPSAPAKQAEQGETPRTRVRVAPVPVAPNAPAPPAERPAPDASAPPAQPAPASPPPAPLPGLERRKQKPVPAEPGDAARRKSPTLPAAAPPPIIPALPPAPPATPAEPKDPVPPEPAGR